jgi:hypothetical protein
MPTRIIADMKFQSLIARIMHGSRPATRAVVFLVTVMGLSGCVSIIAKKNTYGASASSPPVVVNGAKIRMQVKPEGAANGSVAISAMVYSAAIATLEGPFRWRIEATGNVGHESMVVHKIRTRTSKTHRDEWYPAEHLGRRLEFSNGAGVRRAAYPIPGLLQVKSDVDGALDVSVDLSVVRAGRSERKTVNFRMDPSQKRQDEFIFVPTEIVSSFGQTPADWEDAGWD